MREKTKEHTAGETKMIYATEWPNRQLTLLQLVRARSFNFALGQ